jgi:hypothetical protein
MNPVDLLLQAQAIDHSDNVKQFDQIHPLCITIRLANEDTYVVEYSLDITVFTPNR